MNPIFAFIPLYLEERKPLIAPGTYHRYKHILDSMVKANPTDITAWLLALDKSNIVKAEYHLKIGFYFNWCVAKNLLPTSPLLKHSKFKRLVPSMKPDRKPITAAQYDLLLSKSIGTPYWEYAVRTGWATGMRLSDVCLLEKDAVDFSRGSIKVVPQKTRRYGKIIEIPCDDLLMFYRKIFHLFPKSRYMCPVMGEDYHWEKIKCPFGNMMSVKFGVWARSHGVNNTFHGFRHAFVTRLLAARIPAETISTLTGQSIIQIATYYHPTLDDKRKALSCIQ